MKIVVEPSQRLGKMRAHTATHLLHLELEKVLGSTKQAGSLVDCDILRFDFATSRPLEEQELSHIQNNINTYITSGYDVTTEQTTLQHAQSLGAKAFFEDKYGDEVRVVSIVGATIKSIELCGGTHVSNTSHIGAFLITGQESVSSGVRRITAVTGPQVASYASQLQDQRNILAQKMEVQPVQLEDKIEKVVAQLKEQSDQIQSLNTQIAHSYLDQAFPKTETIDRIIKTDNTPLAMVGRKELVTLLKLGVGDTSRLLYSQEGNYAFSHPEAKNIVQEHGITGGGAPNFVQGKDENIIELTK